MLREYVESALMQYFNDNGAAAFSQKHLQPLTDKIVETIKIAQEEEGTTVNRQNKTNKSFGDDKSADPPKLVNGRIIYEAPSPGQKQEKMVIDRKAQREKLLKKFG